MSSASKKNNNMLPQCIFLDYTSPPIAPYSHGIRVGNYLYVSGQIGIDPTTNELVSGGMATHLITGSIISETDMAMKNLGSVLISAGMDYSNVVKCTIMLADLNDYDIVNDIYKKYFKPDCLPARAVVVAAALPKGAKVYIETIAADKMSLEPIFPEDGSAAPIASYSPAVEAGNLLFIAGQYGIDPATGELVPGGFVSELEMAMKNLKSVLTAADAEIGFGNVVKLNVYMADLKDYEALGEVCKKYFPAGKYPARVALQVKRLPMDARVEIDAVAAIEFKDV